MTSNYLFESALFSVEKKYLGIRMLLLFLMFLGCGDIFSQNWASGWVYIENVETGLVLDVKGNVKKKGTSIWPYSLNYTRAQMFRFSQYQIPERFGSDSRRILVAGERSTPIDFCLSVKSPMVLSPDVVSPGRATGLEVIKPKLQNNPLLADADHLVSNQKILSDFQFTIEYQIDFKKSPLETTSSLRSTPKQIWTILPVANESDVYYLQSAQFAEKMVIQPLGYGAGGTLVLSSFTGSNLQKWRILKIKPRAPSDVKVTNFILKKTLCQTPWYKPWEWHDQYNLKGNLTWKNNNPSSSLIAQKVVIAGQSIKIGANETSYKFDVLSTKLAKNKEQCIFVIAFNQWQENNFSSSDKICAIPNDEEITPPPKKPKGVSELIITNCHTDKKSVRLWLYDLTTDNGEWEDKGVLNSQWGNGGCPQGAPKKIDISTKHEYYLVAIDCGDLPPNETDGSCHVLMSSQFKGAGKKKGKTLSFRIG